MRELVEITTFGDVEPRYIAAGFSERDDAVARARALYLADEVDVDEFEELLEEALA